MGKKLIYLGIIMVVFGLMTACQAVSNDDRDALFTQAAETVYVGLTQTAARLTLLPPSATNSPVVATDTPSVDTPIPVGKTPVPTETQVNIPTEPVQPEPPTASPTPNMTEIPTAILLGTPSPVVPTETPAPTAVPCNQLQFVSHVSVHDGTIYVTGTKFMKIWRVKNVGTCAWTQDYDLVFYDGHRMGGSFEVSLPAYILPGQVVDLAVELTAPVEPGNYLGYWTLRDEDGVVFDQDEVENRLSVRIAVFDAQSNFALDFVITYCNADWSSGAADLNCPGDPETPNGSVMVLENPTLETRHEDEPALWVRPNNSVNGWISGIYPPFKIKSGDRFKAWVGCMDSLNRNRCKLTFQLDYQIEDGPVHNLGSWVEEYDGDVTKLDIDLSSLADQSVKFILTTIVYNDNPDAANGFWFVPRIERP